MHLLTASLTCRRAVNPAGPRKSQGVSVSVGAAAALFLLFFQATLGAQEQPKPPKPRRLDEGLILRRNAATGEIRVSRHNAGELATEDRADGDGASVPGTIRVRVQMVEVSANVHSADGAQVAGLARGDFRIFEDGTEHDVAYFDDSSEPARVALLLDTSPSVLREWSTLQGAARALAAGLAPRDEVAVLNFAGATRLLLPFSSDRAQLARAIAAAELQQGERSELGSEIYRSVFLAVETLFREQAGGPPRRGRKAIVLLTDGQDSGLGLGWVPASALPSRERPHRLTFEDVCRSLTSAGVEVYVVSTQNRPVAMTEAWLAENHEKPLVNFVAREKGMPHYTLYLAETVRRAGGRLYFLRETGSLAGAWTALAENLRAQYTLGYYPSSGSAPGWHSLRVGIRDRPDLRATHRSSYYAPASP